jgi:hypothetical protein
MLNRSRESGYPCLIPNLRGNGFSFSALSMMSAIGLSHTSFFMLRCSQSFYTWFQSFCDEMVLNHIEGFFYICWEIKWFLFLLLLICYNDNCNYHYSWSIPASVERSWLGLGVCPFLYVVGFSLPLFYWGVLHQCSLSWLSVLLLFWYVPVLFWDECNIGFIKWLRQYSFPF